MSFIRNRIVVLAIALAFVLPASALAASYSGTWNGSTSQDQTLQFRVNSKNKITFMKVGYKISNGGCTIESVSTIKNLSVAIKDDKFTVRTTIYNGNLTVKGTMVSGSKAKGTLAASVRDTTGFGCSGSTKASWTARG